MAKKPSAPDDPVEEARASGEKRHTDFVAEQQERETRLDAIREEGARQRERDQEEHDKAVLAEAEATAKAREKAGEDERKALADLFKQARKAKAEHDEQADRAFAELLASRREAEKDTDPSVGTQVTLDPDSVPAKAARGGAAPDMPGNVLAAEQAQIAAGAAP